MKLQVRQTNVRSSGKARCPFWNDENDKPNIAGPTQRKSMNKSGVKQRNPTSLAADLKMHNLTLDRKQNDNSMELKQMQMDTSLYFNQLKKRSAVSVKKKISNTQFQLQNNLDTLSQILQTQKLSKKVVEPLEPNQIMSFGVPQDEVAPTTHKHGPPHLEIKTDFTSQMMQLLSRVQPSSSTNKANSTKERKYIDIPKFMYGQTTKASEIQTTKVQDLTMPTNVLLEKRSGGDYFKFDFKQNQKKPQAIFAKEDQIVDVLIEDSGICEEFSRDFCADIKYLNQQVLDEVDDLTKTEQFKEQYKVGQRVGQGAYASVRLAIQTRDNRKVAIKIYEKAKIRDLQRRKGVRREVKLLQKLNHNNIVKIIDTVESNNHINIIMEYVAGGSLHSLLKKQQVTQQYLHSRAICHRDIKLENILLDETQTIPKLIDFGFSTCFPLDRKVKMFCGTPSYMAPEIVSRVEYRGDKADVWALGVVLFALLQGYFPFKGATDGELYKRIQAGELQMTLPVSDSAKSLLESMLHVDPECRFSASEILRHQWMKGAVKKVKPIIAEISLDHELKNQSRTTKHEDIMTNISFITPPNQQVRQFDFTLSSQPKVHSFYLQNQIMKKHPLAQSPMLANPLNRMQYHTTTNAMLQQKKEINNSIQSVNQYFFKAQKTTTQTQPQQNTLKKVSRTQPENGRQKTLSYQLNSKCELQEQENHQIKHSYDSDVLNIFHSISRRGYSPQQILISFQDPCSEIGILYTKLMNDKQRHLLTIYPSYIPSDKSVGSLRSPSNGRYTKSKELSRERSRERHRVHSQSRPFIMDNIYSDDTRNRTFNHERTNIDNY